MLSTSGSIVGLVSFHMNVRYECILVVVVVVFLGNIVKLR